MLVPSGVTPPPIISAIDPVTTTAGIWQGTPVARPDFREKFRKAAAAQAKKRNTEEPV